MSAEFDAAAIREYAAEMQASNGDDLGPMIWRDVQRLARAYEALAALVPAPLRNRVPPSAPDLPSRPAGADEPEADPPETVAADPSIVDSESDTVYGDAVLRGHETSSTPHRRADVELSALLDSEGWVNHSRPEARSGHAATAASVAPTEPSDNALGQRPAAKQEAGGIPGSAPGEITEHERQAWLRRVQAQPIR